MSARILIGFYAIHRQSDEPEGTDTWWTITDRRTAMPVAVDGQPLEFESRDDAEQWAKLNSKAVRT